MTSRQPRDDQRLPRRIALGMLGALALAAGGATLSATGTALGAPRAARLSDAIEPGVMGAADQGGPGGPVPSSLLPGGEFDQFVRSQAAQDQFSGNFLLAYRGRPVLVRSSGMADKALSVPNTPDTLFALASVTKSLTAAAVLQLAQQGKLGFWEPLGTYLGGFPAQVASTVTVHQLLTMTSGMDNYYADPAWLQDDKTWSTAAEVLDGTMGFIREQALRFAPGTQYYYSDSGFVVLGAIMQQVSGQPYWDYMQENIFARADMKRTAFYTKPELLALDARHEVAHPYSTQRTGGTRVDVFGNAGFIGLPDGAGGPYTTAADMLSFATGLRDGTLLNPACADEMLNGKVPLTPPANVSPRQQVWMSGYGLEDTIVGNQHVLCHSGDGPGIATLLDIYPDLDWAVVILENYDLIPFGTTMQDSSVASLERQLITQRAQ